MIEGKKVLGIIPARGGSKGLPGKNIRNLCGKPLIAWTIEKAKKSRYLDVVMLTTDCLEIAEIARDFGAAVPFLRPESLATDEASSYDVVCHTLAYYSANEGLEFDYTALMEPTSPLREDDDIDRMLETLHGRADQFDSIISVGEAAQHPSLVKRLVSSSMRPYCPDLIQRTRRQDNDPAYFPFGVAYITKTRTLLEENTFYTQRCLGYPIKRYQNYEIDDLYDFLCVEIVMKHEWKLQ
jgi:CMP-N,N'-diacetyllegionaminic acid synthase